MTNQSFLHQLHHAISTVHTPDGIKQLPDNQVGGYLRSLILVQLSGDVQSRIKFVKLYIDFGLKYLKKPYSVPSLVNHYARWQKNPELFTLLRFLFKKTSSSLSTDIVEVLAEVGKDVGGKSDLFYARAIILHDVLRQRKVQHCDLRDLRYVISCIRQIPFDQTVLDMSLNEKKQYILEHYHFFTIAASSLLFEGRTELNLSGFVGNFFVQGSKVNGIDFQSSKILFAKLPTVFINNCKKALWIKLCLTYRWRPELFESLHKELIHIKGMDEITEFLFSSFKIPQIIIRKFYCQHKWGGEPDDLLWISHIVKGDSIRSIPSLPCTMSKRASFIFFTLSPDLDLTMKNAWIYSAMLSNGVEEKYAYQAISYIRDFRQVNYWLKVVPILYTKGLRINDLREVMDYLIFKELEEGQVIPLAKLKIQTLRFRVAKWHQDMYFEIHYGKDRKLPSSGIRKYEIPQADDSVITFTQITTKRDLWEEGRAMRHCVFSYLGSVMFRQCYIFSVRKEITDANFTRLLTIELRGNKIVQVKGMFNRPPVDLEMEYIKEWVTQRELVSYIS